MSFSLVEISRGDESVRYGLFLDPAVDPGSDGINSFEVLIVFDPDQATYVTGSLSYPAEFLGLTNEQEAGAGRLRTGGISLTPFANFDDPLIAFDLDVSALVGVGPGDLLLDAIFIDGVNQPSIQIIYTPFPNTDPTGSVTISGTAEVGEQLTADNTLADDDGLGEISYQWYADGAAIPGATGPVYQPTLADKGAVITVVASYIDGQFYPESISSEPTSPVTNPGLLLEGTAGPDTLSGTGGDDTLVGFAGRDTLQGNSGDDELQGGSDIDTAVFTDSLGNYQITREGEALTVSGPLAEGTDRLSEIERLQFSDLSLAFDLDGHAGQVAKLLGTMIGKDDWYVREFVGIGLDILDDGFTFEELMTVALEVVLGAGPTNEAVVNLLWNNLVGGPTPAEILNDLTGILARGELSQVELCLAAAEHPVNLDNIGLVGLIENGLEYLPL